MVDSLVFGWKLHVITIEIGEIGVISRHCLVGLAFKGDADGSNGAADRKTFFHEEISFGHVAHGGCGLVGLKEAVDNAVYDRERQWEISVAEVVEAGIEEIAVLNLAPSHAIDEFLELEDIRAQPEPVGNEIERKDVHIDPNGITGHLVFYKQSG